MILINWSIVTCKVYFHLLSNRNISQRKILNKIRPKWWPIRAKLFLWTNFVLKVNFSFLFDLNFKINLKFNFKFISISISFENQFQFFISKFLWKHFYFNSCFKNVIWRYGPSVTTPAWCVVSFWILWK